MQVFAPLANRLGIWQIKWELEDLAFRFLDPERVPQRSPRLLDERRADREARVAATARRAWPPTSPRTASPSRCRAGRSTSTASGRRCAKRRSASRACSTSSRCASSSPTCAACYAVLGRVHERFRAVAGEFDDYIARPKANGYRSLHTVVQDDDGRAVEIQIRTAEMHEHAEYGVAAHWAYKEADARQCRA